MLKQIDDQDWAAAFNVANGGKDEDTECRGTPEPAYPGCITDTAPFDREDVKRIIAMKNGENDEADWLLVCELNDGRFAKVAAGCDYTGWD